MDIKNIKLLNLKINEIKILVSKNFKSSKKKL